MISNVLKTINNECAYALLLFLLLVTLGNISFLQADESIEVIAHPSVIAIKQQVTRNSLQAIFGMRLRTWPGNIPIKVFVLPDNAPLHQNFSKKKLNVFPFQLRSAWDRLVFSGTGQAPIKVNSNEEMLAKVANTPGAIGYLWRANIDDSVNVLPIK